MFEFMVNQVNKSKNQKGFTLVELIVVIAILGILAAVVVPRISGFTGKAQSSADKANIKTVESALEIYLSDAGFSGDYKADITLSNTGAVGGFTAPTGFPTNLVPKYLKEMPKQPKDSTKSYTKSANAEVVAE